MVRILVPNPNSSPACTNGIDPVVAPFRSWGGPAIDATKDLMEAGAGAVVLGCTGMAARRAAVEAAAEMPMIDPCQAGVAMARLALS